MTMRSRSTVSGSPSLPTISSAPDDEAEKMYISINPGIP